MGLDFIEFTCLKLAICAAHLTTVHHWQQRHWLNVRSLLLFWGRGGRGWQLCIVLLHEWSRWRLGTKLGVASLHLQLASLPHLWALSWLRQGKSHLLPQSLNASQNLEFVAQRHIKRIQMLIIQLQDRFQVLNPILCKLSKILFKLNWSQESFNLPKSSSHCCLFTVAVLWSGCLQSCFNRSLFFILYRFGRWLLSLLFRA